MIQFSVSKVVRFRDTSIGGIPVRNTTTRVLIRFLDSRTKDSRPLVIAFVNQNFVVSCQGLRPLAWSRPEGILLVNDGVGVALAARLATGQGFAENLNGTDLVPRLLRDLKRDLKVFLLGGTPEVVAHAGQIIDNMPRRRVVGTIDGYSIWEHEAKVIAAINLAKPDLLLVGFGNPKQEFWILQHRDALHVSVIFAVGGLFEWMTGVRRRAPYFVRRAGLEWVYRMVTEPRRLFKRYTIDVVRFFLIVCNEREGHRISAWQVASYYLYWRRNVNVWDRLEQKLNSAGSEGLGRAWVLDDETRKPIRAAE